MRSPVPGALQSSLCNSHLEIAIEHQQLVRLRMARRQGMGFQFAEWRGEVLLLQGARRLQCSGSLHQAAQLENRLRNRGGWQAGQSLA
ncbi:hypothetical protein D3C86_1871470 [compost metagenome]